MITSDCISFNTSLLCFASASGDMTVKYEPHATHLTSELVLILTGFGCPPEVYSNPYCSMRLEIPDTCNVSKMGSNIEEDVVTDSSKINLYTDIKAKGT